jgi:DNA-binding GntR family transcriptional regulator
MQSLTVDSPAQSVIEYAGQPGSVRMPKQRYEQVADDLRQKIKSGEYPPGSRLPSRSEMREIYGISDTVSDKALWILRQEHLVETLPGVGVFVAEE